MKIALRIGYYRYFDEDTFHEHLDFIKKYAKYIDEIALFVEYSHHGYWELDQMKKMSQIIKSRIIEYKKAGIKSVGINVLCTIGHTNESWDYLPKPPMQTLVGIDSSVSPSCLCPSTDEYKKYIYQKYQILAESNPDFIWSDDDVRLFFHVPTETCFCPTCIKKFNEEFGHNFTFETLTTALNQNDSAIKTEWRKFQDKTYVNLLELIKNAVRSVNPDMIIGYMSGGDNGNKNWNNSFTHWIEAEDAAKGRPGGGFYNDNIPMNAIDKALSCGNQITTYPEKVTDIQYEFENFPYQTLAKSITISKLECIAAMFCGCNGIAFNGMFYYDYPKMMEMIKSNFYFWNGVSKISDNYFNKGVFFSDLSLQIKFAEIGIPIALREEQACSYVLTDDYCLNISDEKIKSILSKNVFMNAETLKILTDRGFGEYCGVKIKSEYSNGVRERFTDDELNSPFNEHTRDIFVSMNNSTNNYTLTLINNECRILSNLETIKRDTLGPCMTAYENELGGRIVVSSHFHPEFMKSEEKRWQILNVFDWLSKNSLPVRINQCCKVIPFVKQSQTTDAVAILLVNASFDTVSDLQICIRNSGKSQYFKINSDGNGEEIPTKNDENETVVTIDSIEPWNYTVITNTSPDC